MPRDRSRSAEGPVSGDDPSSMANGRVENGCVAAAGDREDRESPSQGQCGSRVGHPPRDEALELVDDGRGNDDASPRTEAVDLGFQRETGSSREQERVGVQKDRTLRPGGRRTTGAEGRLRVGLGRVLRPLDVREARIAGPSGSRSSESPRGTRGTSVP